VRPFGRVSGRGKAVPAHGRSERLPEKTVSAIADPARQLKRLISKAMMVANSDKILQEKSGLRGLFA
jgi:hypothetical protein